MIDLHSHSCYSDGFHTPQALLQLALANHVAMLALTDHDTIAGLEALHQAAAGLPIQIIDGIEISVSWKLQAIHILGLKIDRTAEPLHTLAAQQKQRRLQRAHRIVENLNSLNIINLFEKACEVAGHDNIGRPHLAKILVAEGKAKDMQDAFKRFLRRSRIGYVPTTWVSLEEAISIILQSGGFPVLAHPDKYGFTWTKLESLVKLFKEAGGQGIEVVSGHMLPAQIELMARLCQRYELLASSGSDFHGHSMSSIGLGKQLPLPIRCQPIWQQWTPE